MDVIDDQEQNIAEERLRTVAYGPCGKGFVIIDNARFHRDIE